VRSEDRLRLEGLAFKCIIGVTERERRMKQDILVTVEVGLDLGRVGLSDSIQDTVDYREISRRVIAAGEASSFQLIETLAAHLGRTILQDFPRVEAVRVEVEKPGALSAAKAVRAIVVARRPGMPAG
jgi:dihydroneopterin aldolase/D-erythro-7,8-dihydroneopterin triphosphate epimerase